MSGRDFARLVERRGRFLYMAAPLKVGLLKHLAKLAEIAADELN
jgi:hypothetical protein